MELPSGMVWFHVVLAALTWLALLFSVVAAGHAAPQASATLQQAGRVTKAPV
jgi:hypothetical protein